jgi:hypothetical protein
MRYYCAFMLTMYCLGVFFRLIQLTYGEFPIKRKPLTKELLMSMILIRIGFATLLAYLLIP